MLSKLKKQKTITREYLAKAVKRKTGIGVSQSLVILDRLFSIMTDNIKEGNTVNIRKLGSFYVKEKSERIGRNPRTMEDATIAARKVVKFKVSPTLKKSINDNI